MILMFSNCIKAEDAFDSIETEEPKNNEQAEDIFSSVDETKVSYLKKATIIVINKITANSKEFQVSIGSKVSYGKAEIELHKCAKINNFRKEDLLLVSLKEKSFDNSEKLIFSGWLFSKSPSLSAVEHPIYQLIAVSCN